MGKVGPLQISRRGWRDAIPILKTIFASYSADLGVRTNLDVQRIVKSENFQLASPQTTVDQQPLRCPLAQLSAAPYLNFSAITFRVGWNGGPRSRSQGRGSF